MDRLDQAQPSIAGTGDVTQIGDDRVSNPTGWRRSGLHADLVLVLILTGFTIALMPAIAATTPDYRDADILGATLVVAASIPTALRHRWPELALLGSHTAIAAYLMGSYPYGPIFGFVLLTVYTLARQRPVRRAAVWATVAFVLLVLHIPVNDASAEGMASVIPALAWVAIPFTVGAARRLVVEANARERSAAEKRLVEAERVRLAHEVHDVVGHGLAAIQMHADIALHMKDSRPEQAITALEEISRTSSEGLSELRTTLAKIKPGEVSSTELRAPAPGLARLEALCDRMRHAGLEVDLTITGKRRPLRAAVDVAAYRVLQESLTNVVKHSAHPRAEVGVDYQRDHIILRVINQNLAADAHADGVGISGMRRRVEQLGGRFTAGPDSATGTFEIRATIPCEEAA
ncbi:sensor histidine kinase [Actinobacteria bacterium YIM 96077]|uniref:histidine kinase n=1 Tax=Phytoactinopolyspora halophila TaxID=1981511 RepID=A0A329QLC7_9ACTN|nr:sensor histidine kinase [Phytoactinopolyspora halophila]AYY14856.1 sensor histidine kinase [Actinobacteria bacterium YIM 96077]RAW13130.1 sensor histidine kinase [Phytoactinopolyspora halophila]